MLIWVLTVWSVAIGVQGDCMEDLVKNQAFMDCYQGYTAISASAADNPTIMCSEEGQASLQCLQVFMQQCPDIMGGVSMDELTKMCNMISGPCAGATMCLQGFSDSSAAGFPEPNFDPEKGNIPFVTTQYFIGVVCGPLTEAYRCIEGLDDQCETLVESVKNITNMASMMAMQHGAKFPDYKTLPSFIKNHCPNIPASFGADSCVSTQMASPEYLACVENATSSHNSTGSRSTTFSCEVYNAVTGCVVGSLESTCGKEKSDIMLRYARYFVAGVPQASDCDGTSAASVISISVLSLFLASCAAFLLF